MKKLVMLLLVVALQICNTAHLNAQQGNKAKPPKDKEIKGVSVADGKATLLKGFTFGKIRKDKLDKDRVEVLNANKQIVVEITCSGCGNCSMAMGGGYCYCSGKCKPCEMEVVSIGTK
jgi:hypothetical protein